jgi:hypothetical protein
MVKTATAAWVPQDLWSVPREWPGEKVFILCGGESLKVQRHLVPELKGRIIAVKHGVYLRPDADVLFMAGERPAEVLPPLLKAFNGKYAVVRGKGHPCLPDTVKRVMRPLVHDGLCDDPTLVSGYDAGTSAINLAYHFGAKEIVLLGYDMVGGRWFNGVIPHYLPHPREADFRTHMEPLPLIAEDAKRKGVRIVNCSPISRVTCFERQPLEAML